MYAGICTPKNNCVIIELVPDNLAKWESHNERGVIFTHKNPTVATHELKRMFIISVVRQLKKNVKNCHFLCPCLWTTLTRFWLFLTTYTPPLVNIVCERPPSRWHLINVKKDNFFVLAYELGDFQHVWACTSPKTRDFAILFAL